MRRYVPLAITIFAVGAFVALGWLLYLSMAIGEEPHPITAMKISFPGLFVGYLLSPTQGTTGWMIYVLFALTTIANGIIYALIAVGAYALVSRPPSSN
jgi:hypothetical protein